MKAGTQPGEVVGAGRYGRDQRGPRTVRRRDADASPLSPGGDGAVVVALRPPPDAQRLVGQMSATFPEASVTGYEPSVSTMTCHPKDAHVLAAAVHAGAQFVVTANLKDFPSTATDPHALAAIHPDLFCLLLFQRAPGRSRNSLITSAPRSDSPLRRRRSGRPASQ